MDYVNFMDEVEVSLHRIAEALTKWVEIEARRYQHEYPERSINGATVGTADYRKKPVQEPEEEKRWEETNPWLTNH